VVEVILLGFLWKKAHGQHSNMAGLSVKDLEEAVERGIQRGIASVSQNINVPNGRLIAVVLLCCI